MVVGHGVGSWIGAWVMFAILISIFPVILFSEWWKQRKAQKKV